MSSTQITFTSNDSSVQKSLKLMQDRHQQLINKQKQLADEAKKGGAAAVQAFERNEKAIYNLNLQILRLKANEEKRHAAEQKHSEQAKRRVEEVTRKLQEQSRQKEQDASKARSIMADQISQFKNIVGGLFSINAAVNLVRGSYQDWARDMAEVAKRQQDINAAGIKGLAQVGQLPMAREWFKAARDQQAATPEQFEEVASGVRGAGLDLKPQRQMELAKVGAQVAPTGIDRQQFGRTMGELGEIFPKKAADDIAQMAYYLQGQAGFDSSQLADSGFQRSVKALIDKGMKSEDAIVLALQAVRDDVGTKPLMTLAAKLGEKYKAPPVPAGRAMTDTERLQQAYAKESDPMKRWDMLQESKQLRQKVLGAESATKIDLIDLDGARRQAVKLDQSQAGTFGGQMETELQGSEQGRRELQRQRQAVESYKAKEKLGLQGTEIEGARGELDTQLSKKMTSWGDFGAFFSKEKIHPLERTAKEFEFDVKAALSENGPAALAQVFTETGPSLNPFDPLAPIRSWTPRPEEVEKIKPYLAEEAAIRRARTPDNILRNRVLRAEQTPDNVQFQEEAREAREELNRRVVIREPVVNLPERPKVELPAPPEPSRKPRNPAPLGPTRQERRQAFEAGEQGERVPQPKPAAGDQARVELLPPDAFPRQFQLPDVELLPPKVRFAGQTEDLAATPPRVDAARLPKVPPIPAVEIPPPAVSLPDMRQLALEAPEQAPGVRLPDMPQLALDAPEVRAPRIPGLEIPPPAVSLPDMWQLALDAPELQAPRERVPPHLALDRSPDFNHAAMRDVTRRQAVEPVEIKLPELDKPATLLEQLTDLGQFVGGLAAPGRSEDLLPVLQTIANGFNDLLDETRGARRGIENLASGRPRAAPAIAGRGNRGFNDHFEPV